MVVAISPVSMRLCPVTFGLQLIKDMRRKEGGRIRDGLEYVRRKKVIKEER